MSDHDWFEAAQARNSGEDAQPEAILRQQRGTVTQKLANLLLPALNTHLHTSGGLPPTDTRPAAQIRNPKQVPLPLVLGS